jgi:hypothetical protein
MQAAHLSKGGAHVVAQLRAAGKVQGDGVLTRGHVHHRRQLREQSAQGYCAQRA